MRLTFARRARLDLSAIHVHIALDSALSADRMLLRLTDACAALSNFPDRGRPGIAAGTRELVTVPPYVIVYSVAIEEVEIVRIFHGAQNR